MGILRQKPRRPFGLSIAIMTAILLFTAIPLVVTLFTWYFSRYMSMELGGGASGVNVLGISGFALAGQALAALVFLALALLTWRGQPSMMRLIFQLAVLAWGCATLVLTTLPQLARYPSLVQGIDSGTSLTTSFLWWQTLAVLGLMLYVLWFANRWSARAFFRGYYTEADLVAMQRIGVQVGGQAQVTRPE